MTPPPSPPCDPTRRVRRLPVARGRAIRPAHGCSTAGVPAACQGWPCEAQARCISQLKPQGRLWIPQGLILCSFPQFCVNMRRIVLGAGPPGLHGVLSTRGEDKRNAKPPRTEQTKSVVGKPSLGSLTTSGRRNGRWGGAATQSATSDWPNFAADPGAAKGGTGWGRRCRTVKRGTAANATAGGGDPETSPSQRARKKQGRREKEGSSTPAREACCPG